MTAGRKIFVDTCILVYSVIHDANIVATMLLSGLKELLTQNMSDFSRFSDLIQPTTLETIR